MGDASDGLDQNSSLIAYHLISRLTLLFVELFGSHEVESKELIRSPSDSPALNDLERTASRILSQALVNDCDFVLVCRKYYLIAICTFVELQSS